VKCERVLKGMMCHKYSVCFMIMVIKYAEQTTVKQQENRASPGQTSKGRNNRNMRELAGST
jgi:hypothetical protein